MGPFASPFQDHKQLIASFQDHEAQIIHPSQDHLTTADARDIIALKQEICKENVPYMWTPQYPQYNTHAGQFQ